ncbi:MAG: gliding motility-associated C-terminal domain-containing protein [Chitinophagaceae bacterium]|nr:gliding motility-associated C-terminal domain-containing protein [Chitinophagaceae bacterium]
MIIRFKTNIPNPTYPDIMKNRYRFICWLCCMLVGITVSRGQDFQPFFAKAEPVNSASSLHAGTPTGSFSLNSLSLLTEENPEKAEGWAIGSNLIISNQTICENATPASLTGTLPTGGTGTFDYQWQSSTASGTSGFSNIPLAASQHYAPPALTTTTWYRRVVVSGAESDTSASIQITVKPSVINLVITNPDPVCAPQAVDITVPAITAGSTPGLTLTYHTTSTGGAVLANPNSISAATSLNKDYYIKGTNGCQIGVVKPVRVVINKQPTVSISSPPGPVCKYSPVVLMAFSIDAGTTTTWQNIGPGPMVTVYPQETTTYTSVVTMPVTGCQRVVPVTVNVKEFSMSLAASPQPVIAGNPVTFTPGSATSFTVTGWLPENLFPSQIAATQTIAIQDTTRTFSVIGRSEDGCLDTASVKVNMDVNTTDVFVPNAFTPNNDGKNDIFKVYGSSIKNIEMKIFDQWGRAIHETNNNSTGWDGNHNGKLQPAGTYMYVIKIRLENEDSFIRKGTIHLIR